MPKRRDGGATTKQKIALAGMAQGMKQKDAGALAGYSSPQNAHDGLKRLADRLGPLLDEVGLTERYILTKLRESTVANKLELAQRNGQFTDIAEVPDNATRIKAIESAARIRRMFPERDSDENDKSTVAVQIITNVQLDKP
jgi:hypothetical protein